VTPRVQNIGARGAERRRRGGMVWLVVGVLGAAALVGVRAPRAWALALAIPFAAAATGFLQARERT